MWYTSIQQLISRVGHPDPAVVALLHAVLIKIASAHSRESVWSIAPLFASNNDVRRKAGQVIMKSTAQALSRAGLEEESVAFAGAKHLFSDLIKNAEFQTDEKKTALKMTRNIILSDYVVPNCKTLTPVLQPKAVVSREGAGHDPFPRSTTRIAKFHETMTVMHSKAKPKKVSLDTTAGETVSYLCKREKNGDLRKDARLMEFNAVVNRMLQRDVAGRHRRLRLRTYAVICLNEECGLLEWVPNTVPMRTLIADAYAVHPAIPNPRFTAPSVRDAFCSMQQQRVSQHAMGESFRDDFFGQFTPCFHRWFLKSFPEPTAWFEARTAYTRSVAVWSAVGHVVGLGDRHLENILIDVRCGECVHVDFDCLFDKGITLARPEVVPFRLTSHLVEAFGVTGYEGIFRRVMECTFSVLRENQETLVSVLEPFLQDPTMGWDRQGRAQRKDDDAERRPAPHDATIDPKRVLSTVRGRLRGVFNLRDSHAWSSRAVKPIPPMGISDSNLAFSVQGQVDRLIQEATSDENLCLMYVGWMPWL
jgi:serine/threonine-protein kinase ATR